MEVFVGCSGSNDIENKYMEEAVELGKWLVKNKHTLIFGSSESGMMGKIYHEVFDHNGKVISVTPLKNRGIAKFVDSIEVKEVTTPLDQLKELVNMGDMTIILPGGYGTITELNAAIASKKLGENNKEIIIVNSFGYFDELLKMYDKILQENFDCINPQKLYRIVNSVKEI